MGDDIIVTSNDARAILKEFKVEARYALKGVGTPSYYLEGNFGRITTSLLKKIQIIFKDRLPQDKFKGLQLTMSPDYRPEKHDSPLLSPEERSRYRMLVGSAL